MNFGACPEGLRRIHVYTGAQFSLLQPEQKKAPKWEPKWSVWGAQIRTILLLGHHLEEIGVILEVTNGGPLLGSPAGSHVEGGEGVGCVTRVPQSPPAPSPEHPEDRKREGIPSMESYEGKYRNTRRYPAKAGSADLTI